MEKIRNTVAEGELVKLNLRQCRQCGKVWVLPIQANKSSAVQPGWYESIGMVRGAFELDKKIVPVIRISPGKRGNMTCTDCKPV